VLLSFLMSFKPHLEIQSVTAPLFILGISCWPCVLPIERPEIPLELQRGRRGCRAGAKCCEKEREYKPSILFVIMGNVGSLPNKM